MFLRVVRLLVFPHRQHRCSDAPGDGDHRQVRFQSSIEEVLVVLVQWVVRHLRGHQVRGALEDLLQRVSSGWALRARLSGGQLRKRYVN